MVHALSVAVSGKTWASNGRGEAGGIVAESIRARAKTPFSNVAGRGRLDLDGPRGGFTLGGVQQTGWWRRKFVIKVAQEIIAVSGAAQRSLIGKFGAKLAAELVRGECFQDL